MRALFIVASGVLLCAGSAVHAVTIDWLPVGNPGNAADTTGYGAVGHSYDIAAYDVTNSQYVEFLNAKDPNGNSPLVLYNSNMSSVGGIAYNAGAASGSKYSAKLGDENHPVACVTWYDAIRFANWLNNGQGNGDTETGAYELGSLKSDGTPVNPSDVTRKADATVFLPSEDEWYKAAYYDPRTTAEGGPPSDSHYWLFPTSSDTAPTATSPTSTPNSANYYPGGPNSPTDVGAYTRTTSPSGAYDTAGNVWQWNEALINGTYRGLRGGSYVYSPVSDTLVSSTRIDGAATLNAPFVGFRVAMVPEPPTLALAVLGLTVLGAFRWRRKGRGHSSSRK